MPVEVSLFHNPYKNFRAVRSKKILLPVEEKVKYKNQGTRENTEISDSSLPRVKLSLSPPELVDLILSKQ